MAARIRWLRRQRGWSQEDLAEAAGLHRTYVGALERGERNCSLEVLERLAQAFGLSLSELLDFDGGQDHGGIREAPAAYGTVAPIWADAWLGAAA